MIPEKWDKYTRVHHPPALIRIEASDARRKEIEGVIKRYIPKDWQRDELILAVGCGDGFEMDVLAALGFEHVRGVTNDVREVGDKRIWRMDMHDMIFGDGQFAYVYSKEVLEHTPAPYLCLRELHRVMRIGGQALHLISTGIDKQRETYHFSCFPDWVWFDLFQKAGFKVLKIYEYSIQLGFLVEKIDVDFDREPEKYSYHLREELARVPRETLEL